MELKLDVWIIFTEYRLHLVVNLRFFSSPTNRDANMVESWKKKDQETLPKNVYSKCSKSKTTMKEHYCSSEKVFCFAPRIFLNTYMICEKYRLKNFLHWTVQWFMALPSRFYDEIYWVYSMSSGISGQIEW